MRIPDTRDSSGIAARPPVEWLVRPLASHALDDEIPDLARRVGVPPLVARLLWLRGVRTDSRARSFLSPRLADLSPPEGLHGLDKATDRLARALRSGERIAVCGDYDVDGMTGTALLVRFFRLAGGDVVWSIPDRTRDGYGLSNAAIDRLHELGVQVAVTVDNGVTAIEPIRHATALGMDVIITDHHLPGAEVPPALAIVNPRMVGEPAGDDAAGDDAAGDDAGQAGSTHDLCGCGLAFQVAWAVADRLRGRGVDAVKLKAFLRDAIGLVALATVCDVVPLRGQNRILVAAGLAALRRSPHPGIRSLLEVCQLGSLPLTTEDVGFKIGPRLNAAGRLSRPELVVELLTSDDAARCRELAEALDQANRERRQIERGVLVEAEAQAAELVSSRNPSSLVVWGEGWHMGVVGIVAARLVDKYARPTAVIGFLGDRGRGSCRTPETVDVHAALCASGQHLESYGGHARAAGLDIRLERADAFRDAFEGAVRKQHDSGPVQRLHIDVESDIDEWSLGTVEAVRRLAPFGSENPEPIIALRGVRVAGKPRLMGQASTHLSFALRQAGGAIRVVGFRAAEHFDLVASGCLLDVAVTPTVNEWRGIRSPEFRLVDIRPA